MVTLRSSLPLWLLLLLVVGKSAAQGRAPLQLYWTNTPNGIERSTLEGTARQSVIPNAVAKSQGIALDHLAQKIYWTDWVSDKISRANLDGSDLEELVVDGLQLPEGIALDLQGQKMYWVDSGTRKVQRANLDGSDVEDLVTQGLINLDAIAIHPEQGKMYWTDWGGGGAVGRVLRANLDGSQVQVIFSQSLDILPGLALDMPGGKIYWTNSTGSKIQRANLDGSAVEDVLAMAVGSPNGLTLHLPTRQMYWTDASLGKIRRANMDDGGALEDIVTDDLPSPRGIAIAQEIPVSYDRSPGQEPLWTLYPNPAWEQLTVSGLVPGSVLRVLDATGRYWQQWRCDSPLVQVDVAALPAGLYQVQVADGRGEVRYRRWVKM